MKAEMKILFLSQISDFLFARSYLCVCECKRIGENLRKFMLIGNKS
jgi:hypothetical protein